MAAPFVCGCGAAACMGTVAGLRHLAPAAQDALAPLVSPYLRRRLAAERDPSRDRA